MGWLLVTWKLRIETVLPYYVNAPHKVELSEPVITSIVAQGPAFTLGPRRKAVMTLTISARSVSGAMVNMVFAVADSLVTDKFKTSPTCIYKPVHA
jgi:hypothetical protein